MSPIVTVRRAGVAAAALALLAIPGMASAATAWSVAHPPYTAVDNVPYAPLNAVTAVSAANVWAVGQSSGTPLIDHYNGSRWSQSTQLGGLAHYNGTSWTTTSLPSGVNVLTAHTVSSPGRIWFAGYYYPSNAITAPALLSTTSG